jgi:hypothetical protein
MATLAAGNVILLDLMPAALTLAGPLAVLQFFDELAKRDLLEKVKSGWRHPTSVLALFLFPLYFAYTQRFITVFPKKSL